MITDTLGRLAAGENLSQDEMTATMDMVMRGHVTDEQIALLLTALRAKGETVEEIAGAAASLRKQMTPIRSRHDLIVDTCGTGGTGSKLFNISTTAALVTAAVGVPVAKHGNRAVTSRTGSADVLSALGVDVMAEAACVERCLDEIGICFCFAPIAHPSMKRVAEVRRKLGVPTIFNLLGPLTNPAGAPFQLLGVGRTELRQTMAKVLAILGSKRAAVVSGEDGLGEVTIAADTLVTEVVGGKLREHRWKRGRLRAESSKITARIGSSKRAAECRNCSPCVGGRTRAGADIVIANSATALWVAGKCDSLKVAAETAAEAIDSGAAERLLERLVQLTNQKKN